MNKSLAVASIAVCFAVVFLVSCMLVFEAGLKQGKTEGYINGLVDGAGSGFTIRDPTYNEVLSFVASDDTDKERYIMTSNGGYAYNCFNYCHDFLENAFGQGLKAGFVYVEFEVGAHAIVCFDTVDKGLVYVEPQNDLIVNLTVGEAYDFVEAPNTIERFTIIW